MFAKLTASRVQISGCLFVSAVLHQPVWHSTLVCSLHDPLGLQAESVPDITKPFPLAPIGYLFQALRFLNVGTRKFTFTASSRVSANLCSQNAPAALSPG